MPDISNAAQGFKIKDVFGKGKRWICYQKRPNLGRKAVIVIRTNCFQNILPSISKVVDAEISHRKCGSKEGILAPQHCWYPLQPSGPL